MLWAGGWSRLLFCEERLVGKVCGSALMAWQQWTPAEATLRNTSTQKVERHVGDSSTGPTLRTEEHFTEGGNEQNSFRTIQLLPMWLCKTTNIRVLCSKLNQPQWAELHAGSLDGTASVLVLHQPPLEQTHWKGRREMLQHAWKNTLKLKLKFCKMSSTNHGKSSKMGLLLVLNMAMIAGRSVVSGSPEGADKKDELLKPGIKVVILIGFNRVKKNWERPLKSTASRSPVGSQAKDWISPPTLVEI